MTLKDKFVYGFIVFLFLTIIGLVIYGGIKQYQYQEELKKMNNQISELTPTIKIIEGTFGRMVMDNANLIKELEKTNKELADKFKKMDLDLLQVTRATVAIQNQIFTLSGDIKDKTPGQITTKPEGEGVRVDFDQTQGYYNLKGYTLSKPLKAEINLSQVKPLDITTTLVRNDKGIYEAFITFPQDYPIKDYKVTSQIDMEKLLDPYKAKWYNQFFVGLSAYAKQTGGALIAPSVSYKINNFLFGISVGLDTEPSVYYGIELKYNIGGKN